MRVVLLQKQAAAVCFYARLAAMMLAYSQETRGGTEALEAFRAFVERPNRSASIFRSRVSSKFTFTLQ
jgi:hypothetical protein